MQGVIFAYAFATGVFVLIVLVVVIVGAISAVVRKVRGSKVKSKPPEQS